MCFFVTTVSFFRLSPKRAREGGCYLVVCENIIKRTRWIESARRRTDARLTLGFAVVGPVLGAVRIYRRCVGVGVAMVAETDRKSRL